MNLDGIRIAMQSYFAAIKTKLDNHHHDSRYIRTVSTTGCLKGDGAGTPLSIDTDCLSKRLFTPENDTLYVSDSGGNDANDGSREAPFKTIAAAAAAMGNELGSYRVILKAGDTFNLSERVNFNNRKILITYYDDPVYGDRFQSYPHPNYRPWEGLEVTRPVIYFREFTDTFGSVRLGSIAADTVQLEGVVVHMVTSNDPLGGGSRTALDTSGKSTLSGCIIRGSTEIRTKSVIGSDVGISFNRVIIEGGYPIVDGTGEYIRTVAAGHQTSVTGQPSYTSIPEHEIRDLSIEQLVLSPMHNPATGAQFNFKTAWNPY